MYKVLVETTAEALEQSVNTLLAEGYTPLGGVSTVIYAQTLWFSQALIKEDKDANTRKRGNTK